MKIKQNNQTQNSTIIKQINKQQKYINNKKKQNSKKEKTQQ